MILVGTELIFDISNDVMSILALCVSVENGTFKEFFKAKICAIELPPSLAFVPYLNRMGLRRVGEERGERNGRKKRFLSPFWPRLTPSFFCLGKMRAKSKRYQDDTRGEQKTDFWEVSGNMF